MIVFNPVIRNGRFEISNGDVAKAFSGVDVAQAKFKFCQALGLPFNPRSLSAKTIRETVRVNNPGGGL